MASSAVFDVPASVDSLVTKASDAFQKAFNGQAPVVAAFAPGRVNIIGEHTDYNDGFVFPMAIEMGTIAVGRVDFIKPTASNSSQSSLPSLDVELLTVVDEKIATELGDLLFVKHFEATAKSLVTTSNDDFPSGNIWNPPMGPIANPHWVNYVVGVIAAFSERLRAAAIYRNMSAISLKIVFAASVPIGAGLSSSASLQVATFILLSRVLDSTMSFHSPTSDLVAAAEKCLWVEQTFAKLPCGIMDQMISFVGKSGNAILLDCRPMSAFNNKDQVPFQHVPLPSEKKAVFVIGETGVCHELASSEYALRREQCHQAAAILGTDSLRKCGDKWPPCQEVEQLFRTANNEVALRRARHVVTENGRCSTVANLLITSGANLSEENLNKIGALMIESHRSLANDFEVSCKELDQLVDAALASPGVYGSRMTGGGFGGCTVTMVKPENSAELAKQLRQAGAKRVFLVTASDGARPLFSSSSE